MLDIGPEETVFFIYLFIRPEESVVLNALLPEVFALVPLVKVELNYILVVTLLRYICQIL